MATATEVRQSHEVMLETAARLVGEIADVPAGVVLRSYWRAVRVVRRAGCPVHTQADEADVLARNLLVERGMRVPHPRRTGPLATGKASAALVTLRRGGS